MSYNTGKRLSESDVFEIFSSVSDNQKPPTRLTFTVIRIPKDGLKLSPPPFEFEDGFYVLIRSPQGQLAEIPSELSDRLLTDDDLASLPSCPWSLSGPQYPKRAKQQVQQRYCYPRGDSSYSSGKGGAMWTMMDSSGREDIDCRILHVYHSNKRAGTCVKPAIQDSKPAVKTAGDKRKGKRKSSGKGREGSNKKVPGLPPMPALMREDLVKSPCPSQMSFELDSTLDFTSDNLFEGVEGDIHQSFSFVPVKSKASSSEDSLLNNPAFNSAASRPPAAAQHYNGYYGYNYGHHYYGHSRYSYNYWARKAPSIPNLTTSSDQKANHAGNVSNTQDFSKMLQDFKANLALDISNSKSADQLLKLAALQNWAKELATKPLQPQKEAAAVKSTEDKSQSKIQSKIKMEDSGTPSITP